MKKTNKKEPETKQASKTEKIIAVIILVMFVLYLIFKVMPGYDYWIGKPKF